MHWEASARRSIRAHYHDSLNANMMTKELIVYYIIWLSTVKHLKLWLINVSNYSTEPINRYAVVYSTRIWHWVTLRWKGFRPLCRSEGQDGELMHGISVSTVNLYTVCRLCSLSVYILVTTQKVTKEFARIRWADAKAKLNKFFSCQPNKYFGQKIDFEFCRHC